MRLFANVEVIATPRWEAEFVRTQKPFDVIIFDRVTVPQLTQGNFILINTVAPNLPLQLQGEARNAARDRAVREAPGDRRLESRRLARAGGVARGGRRRHDGARAAVDGPLLVAFERGKLRVLFIGFDLTASDLPFRVAFPVLFHNVFEWFQPGRVEFPAEGAKAGTPFALRFPPATASWRLPRRRDEKRKRPQYGKPVSVRRYFPEWVLRV